MAGLLDDEMLYDPITGMPMVAGTGPQGGAPGGIFDRAFSAMTGGRNLDNDIARMREFSMPRSADYVPNWQKQFEGLDAFKQLGAENIRSGNPARGVLGVGQQALGQVGQALAPFTAALETYAVDPIRRTFGDGPGNAAALAADFVDPTHVAGPARAAVSAARRAAEYAPDLAMAAAGARAVRAAPEGLLDNRELTGAFAPAKDPVRGETSKELVAQQKTILTPEEMDKFEALKANNPAFSRASKYLTGQEVSELIRNPNAIGEMNRLFDVLPTAAEMTSMAKAGMPKQGWYRGSTQALIDIFGMDDAPRFAALLAATSPQTSVESNLMNTLNIWKNWTAAGRPTDPAQIKAVMGRSVQGNKGEESVLPAWVGNSVRALAADDPLKIVLSGPKVDSFFRNLADDVYRVTNDAWMANATGISQDILRVSPTANQLDRGNPGYSAGYLALNARAREAGERANLFPSEAQETMWSVAMPLMEGQTRFNMPARDILQQGLLTPELIRGTPDFSTLLKTNPAYASVLEQAGYGDRLAAMKPFEFPRQLPEMTTADQRNLMNVAARLENLRDTRNRESRALVQGFRPEPDRATVFMQGEAVPGLGTKHDEGILNANFNQKQAYTGKISNIFQNDSGHDIVLSNLFPRQTIATRTMTGAYTPPGGTREISPGFSMGVEVPVYYTRGGNPRLRSADEDKLEFASLLKSGFTAQHATPWNAQVRHAEGPNVVLARDSKLTPQGVQGLLDTFGEDRIAVADNGRGANILTFKEPITPDEGRVMAEIADAKDFATTREASNPKRNYPDLSTEWGAGEGSRQVTTRLVTAMEKLKPADFNRVDNREIRQIAGELLDFYESRKARGELMRDDLLNMLRIVRDGGLKNLKQQLANPDAYLPAIATIGLAPYVLRNVQSEDE